MKILIVCSGNKKDFNFEKHQSFIYDQINSIKKEDMSIEFDYFFIKGKGVKGYFSNLRKLRYTVNNNNFDLIHAHFSLSALLANLQRKVPVISTFHGSDINRKLNRVISFFVIILSSENIFVSKKLFNNALIRIYRKSWIIPCGVDFDLFHPQPLKMQQFRKEFHFEANTIYILFSSVFNNKVKNYTLLENALKNLSRPKIEVIELNNFKRVEVSKLLNAINLAIMTSWSEGSPQFIKEAMACNTPIVSTDVGDVREVIGNTEGCFITSFDPEDVSEKIKLAIEFNKRTIGRKTISNFDNTVIARKILGIYYKYDNNNKL